MNSYSDLDMLVFLQNVATTGITSCPFQGKGRRGDNLGVPLKITLPLGPSPFGTHTRIGSPCVFIVRDEVGL